MADTLPLIQLARTLCLQQDAGVPNLDANTVDWLVRTGCAPAAWYCWRDRLPDEPNAHKLQGAELTARVMQTALLAHAAETLAALNAAGIDVAPLKGLSAARRWYPEPHLRVMGDIDLLLKSSDIPQAVALLEARGFVSRGDLRAAGYETHHHVAPLWHSDWQLWIELHHALLKPDFVAAADPPFDAPWANVSDRRPALGGERVYGLSRELELMYIAASLCLDLVLGFPNERLQRNVIDATLILSAGDREIDTPQLLTWSTGTSSGACLLVLLHYLHRHALFDGRQLVPALLAGQAFVDLATCRIFAQLIDRYVARPRHLGWAAQRTLPGIAEQLLRRRPAWRNRLHASLQLRRLLWKRG
jgi:hypothetical protein